MNTLIDTYDAALFDLDGVVYLGPQLVEGADEGIAALHDRGVKVGFVTNNAARRPQTVVDQLVGIGIPAAASDVVTSAQASARMMAEALAPGTRVLVVGTQALADEVSEAGLVPVWSSTEEPAAVVQGYDPNMTWPRIDDACHAIQAGAQWFVTNTDSTRPTDKGLVPGAGAQVAAVRGAVAAEPRIAGKPCTPLLEETVRRLDCSRPIFVGDRIDTDIMGAVAVGMDSLFVFTGAHGMADLLAADASGRPTHIGWDLRALVDAPREVQLEANSASCNGQRVVLTDGQVQLDSSPVSRGQQLDALWAALQLVWAGLGTLSADATRALDQLH